MIDRSQLDTQHAVKRIRTDNSEAALREAQIEVGNFRNDLFITALSLEKICPAASSQLAHASELIRKDIFPALGRSF